MQSRMGLAFKKLLKLLESHGWTLRQNGNTIVATHADGRVVTMHRPHDSSVPPMMLKNVLRDACLRVEDVDSV